MKLFAALFILLLSTTATAETLSGEKLARALGADLRYGAGQTNQRSYPIITMRFRGSEEELAQAIERVYGDRFTVTVDQTPMGRLFAVADIYSPSCSGCAQALPDPKANLEGAFFFQMISIEDDVSLVLGTPGIAHTAASYPAGRYAARNLQDVRDAFDLKIQTRYRFHRSEVYTAVGQIRGNAGEFLGKLARMMDRNGYHRVGETNPSDRPLPQAGEAIDETLTWTHPLGLVQVHVERGAGRPQTKVNIYEVTSQ